MRSIVESGAPTGVIGYMDDQPIGWCAVAPRDEYPVLARSRILRCVDDQPVWSITCLFVQKAHRRKGLTVRLIAGAAEYAATQGAGMVEAYPVDVAGGQAVDTFAWTGIASAFERAGFQEVLRRPPTRPIMRLEIDR